MNAGPALQRAWALAQEGHLDEARALYDSVADAPLSDPPTLQLFGAVALRLGDVDAAAARLKLALRRAPRDAQSRLLLGIALRRKGDLPAAAGALRQALRLRPGWADAAYNLSLVLERQGRLDDAAAEVRRALDDAPDDADLWNQLGHVETARGRFDEALAALRRAVEAEPAHAPFSFNLAQELLRAGELDEGWTRFEARRAFSPSIRPPAIDAPEWEGEPLDGKRLLVWSEQGLGDAVQFARWIPRLAEAGARIVLCCPAPARRLLARVPGCAETVAPDDAAVRAAGPFDVHVPLLSLPRRTGRLEPPPAPALDVPALEAGRLRDLDARSGGADGSPRWGVVWAGNPAHADDATRSLSRGALRRLLDTPGVRFVNLQHGPAREVRHPALADPGEKALGDLETTAAWMRALDGVVCVDTAAAHVAGSVGARTLLLLSAGADWRWGRAGERSVWYPTLRIARQSRPGDWKGAIETARPRLRQAG